MKNTEQPCSKQHRSPPPRPSPAAGFALQGRGQFGGKMDEQLSNHSPFYSLPRSEAQRGRVGEGVALWSVYLLFVQNPVYIHLSAPGVCKWMAGIRVLSHCGLFAAPTPALPHGGGGSSAQAVLFDAQSRWGKPHPTTVQKTKAQTVAVKLPPPQGEARSGGGLGRG